MKLNRGDHVVILGCSNGLARTSGNVEKIEKLKKLLEEDYAFKVVIQPSVFIDNNTGMTLSARSRADILVDSITKSEIKAVFDVSGGDLSNELLAVFTEADWKHLKVTRQKYYVGYSDNSVLLNSFMQTESIIPVNFQLLKLVEAESETAKMGFESVFVEQTSIEWQMLNADISNRHATLKPQNVIGGNIRCFLKLAGTDYWPKNRANVLLLEAYSGDIEKIRTYFAQLSLIGIFTEVDYLILGNFTEIHNKQQEQALYDLARNYASQYRLELYHSQYIGHHNKVFPFKMRL